MMKTMRDSASGGFLKYILLGILAMAVGGLVFTDVGGFFRGGSTGSNNIAKVGGQKISIQKFDVNLGRLLQRASISRQEAYARGYIQQFVNEQIRDTLINQLTNNLGIHPSDEKVKDTVKILIAPSIANGQDPETALNQLLAQKRMSETDFLQAIHDNIAREPFMNALRNGGTATSPMLIKSILNYQNEQRNISYVVFKNKDSKNAVKPTQEQLQSLYQSTKETYASPETRDIQVIEIDFKAPEGMDENDILEEQYALADSVDDLAAGGATPEEIKEQADTKLYDIEGLSYLSDQHDQSLVVTAFDLEENEISPVFETDEGKFVAVALKKINTKNYKPFEKVKSDLEKRWNDDQKVMNNKLQTLTLVNEIREGKKKLSSLGKTVSKKIALTRQSEKIAPFDGTAIGALFDAPLDQPLTVQIKDGIAIAIVTSSKFPKVKTSTDTAKAIEKNIQTSIENEAIILYLENSRKKTNIAINQALLERAYGTQPEQP